MEKSGWKITVKNVKINFANEHDVAVLMAHVVGYPVILGNRHIPVLGGFYSNKQFKIDFWLCVVIKHGQGRNLDFTYINIILQKNNTVKY
jgi:hypothetical protein